MDGNVDNLATVEDNAGERQHPLSFRQSLMPTRSCAPCHLTHRQQSTLLRSYQDVWCLNSAFLPLGQWQTSNSNLDGYDTARRERSFLCSTSLQARYSPSPMWDTSSLAGDACPVIKDEKHIYARAEWRVGPNVTCGEFKHCKVYEDCDLVKDLRWPWGAIPWSIGTWSADFSVTTISHQENIHTLTPQNTQWGLFLWSGWIAPVMQSACSCNLRVHAECFETSITILSPHHSG